MDGQQCDSNLKKRVNLIYISNRSNSVNLYDNITEGDFIEDENKDIKKF